MGLKLITPASGDPVTLADAKAHVRVVDTTDDAYITALITAATQAAESWTGRRFLTQTWDHYLDEIPWLPRWPASPTRLRQELTLPLAPVQSVTSMTSYNDAGIATVMPATQYHVDLVSEPGRIVLSSSGTWPTDLRAVNAVVIRLVVGYGAAGAVPQAIKQAIYLLVGHYYENREQVQGSALAGMPIVLPFGVEALLAPYQLLTLA